MRKIFVTGTDTNIGKTYSCMKLLKKFSLDNYKVQALKPVATGCDGNFSSDTVILQKYASVKLSHAQMTPFCFPPPVSPNIASSLTAEKIYKTILPSLKDGADICIIEGIGGWLTPLNNQQTMADLVKLIKDVEIILVVGIKLGCLNHTLLTYESIRRAKLNFLGWIANLIDPEMIAIEENISTLQQFIGQPPLEIFKYDRQST